ncbi:hypothetical protein BDZ97DRAFT_1409294 [Flammula alnicola]|nr:hypothetical protein BDZ97DRAFT_1409294 [Flammula alnicola]
MQSPKVGSMKTRSMSADGPMQPPKVGSTKAPATSADASSNSPLDACPVIASGDAEFPALLRAAIDREDECSEILPGATSITSAMKDAQPVKKARFDNPTPALDTADNSPSNPSRQQSRQHCKKRRNARNKKILGDGYHSSAQTTRKCLSSAEIVQTALDTANLPVASGARTALNKPIPQNPSEIPEINNILITPAALFPRGLWTTYQAAPDHWCWPDGQ